jgi:hypothetical protein
MVILLVTLIAFISSKSSKNINTGMDTTARESAINSGVRPLLDEEMGEIINEKYKTESERRYGDNIGFYDYAGSVVYEFIDYINSREYQKAYEMISPAYKREKDYSIEKLKKDFDFKGIEKSMSIKSFENMDDYYLLEIDLIDFEMDSDVGKDGYDRQSNYLCFTVYRDNTLAPERIATIESRKLSIPDMSEEVSKINIVGMDTLYDTYNIGITGIDSINKSLKLAIALMPTINKDLKKQNVSINDYYNTNEDLLFDIYGIKDQNEFIKIADKLNCVEVVKGAKVIPSAAKEIGNILLTDLIITTNSNEITFELKIVAEQMQNEEIYFVFIK